MKFSNKDKYFIEIKKDKIYKVFKMTNFKASNKFKIQIGQFKYRIQRSKVETELEMHPNIRYQDNRSPSSKYGYDQGMSYHMNSNTQYQVGNQENLIQEPILTRHKSNNIDVRFYQENNFGQSYRLPSNNFQNKQSSKVYQTVSNANFHRENYKPDSNNQFFNDSEHYHSKQQPRINTIQNKSMSSYQVTSSYANVPKEVPQTIMNSNPFQNDENQCFMANNSSKSSNFDQQSHNQKIISFVRQQMEIGVKQFSERMNKIILEQAKQIKDLRKNLINNEKRLIQFQKMQNQIDSCFKESNISRGNKSPNNDRSMKKSPSKLSLTKSNGSTISINHQQNRQKITMVSKELSPSKNYVNQSTRSIERQNSQNTKLSSGNVFTPEELMRKIKILEQNLQITLKIESQSKDKIFKLNNKTQIIEKGLINILNSKLSKAKNYLNSYIQKQNHNIHSLYQQIKALGNKLNNTEPASFLSNTQHLGSNNHIQNQKLTSSINNSMKHQPNTHSSPSIILNRDNGMGQFQVNKLHIKMKNFFSELQDLKELATNLRTKQYKYDHFKIDGLSQSIQRIQQEIYDLQRQKHTIATKLHEIVYNPSSQQNIRKSSQQIDISKSKHSINDKSGKYSKTNQLDLSQQNSNSISFIPNVSANNQKQTNQQNTKKFNINRNQSLEYSCSLPNHQEQLYSKSFKHDISSHMTQYTKKPRKSSNHIGQKNNYSKFNEFSGQESYFSQCADQSVFEKEYPYKQKYIEDEQQDQRQNHFQGSNQSFQKSSSNQDNEAQDQFYHVELDKSNRNNLNSKIPQNSKSQSNINEGKSKYSENGFGYSSQQLTSSNQIKRFMQVIEYRGSKPLKIQIDETGYIKSAQNGMYIVDRNMDGFDFSNNELQWLQQRGIVIIQN